MKTIQRHMSLSGRFIHRFMKWNTDASREKQIRVVEILKQHKEHFMWKRLESTKLSWCLPHLLSLIFFHAYLSFLVTINRILNHTASFTLAPTFKISEIEDSALEWLESSASHRKNFKCLGANRQVFAVNFILFQKPKIVYRVVQNFQSRCVISEAGICSVQISRRLPDTPVR